MICASEIFSNLNHWVYSHCAALFLSSCGNWGLENKFEKIAILWSLMASLVAQTVKCLHPWVGKIPWRRKWQLTPVLLPGKFHGQRSLVSYSPRGLKESDTTERLHFTSLHFTSRLSATMPESRPQNKQLWPSEYRYRSPNGGCF